MQLDFHSEKPLYLQIAEGIEGAVFTGAFAEGEQVPSTTEISATYAVNPATVLKGMNLLVERGILHKRRGLGMFVTEGAVDAIRRERQAQFYARYVVPLLAEAHNLGLTRADIISLIEKEQSHERD